MAMMKHFSVLLSFFLSFALHADEETIEEPISLSRLAQESDLVAIAQVRDTDYVYTREFPSGGSAYLRVLIPYKVSRPIEDFIEIYDEGLHENECYFENPTVFEEGRRYLVFLKFSEDVTEQYKGHPRGCALDVFVTQENRYALKYPVTGIELSDDLETHAREMQFMDNYAVVADEDISPTERNDLLARGLLQRIEERFRHTHGIDLATVRRLMGPDALTLDRSLK